MATRVPSEMRSRLTVDVAVAFVVAEGAVPIPVAERAVPVLVPEGAVSAAVAAADNTQSAAPHTEFCTGAGAPGPLSYCH